MINVKHNRAFIELLDTRPASQPCRTGFMGIFNSIEETLAEFEKARRFQKEGGCFQLNLYIGGDLTQTIRLDEQGFTALFNAPPPAPEFSLAYEKNFQRMAANHRRNLH